MTGVSLWMTSASKVAVVTAVAMESFRSEDVRCSPVSNDGRSQASSLESVRRPCLHRCRTSPITTRSSAAILDVWERGGHVRAGARAETPAGPRFSFFDGPVTANKALAVHTAWGRTLKDVFQRYKALNGFHQRYQNGFDCQGLWIEVGVEKSLGLNSKKEIEEYGLAEFARKCRDVVAWSAEELTKGLDPARPVDGLGQRLLHVLRHEHRVHLAVPRGRPREGLADARPPADRVVPPLRHVDLGARAARELRGEGRPVAAGALPAARPARARRS